jgi:predicted transcriptional regulator
MSHTQLVNAAVEIVAAYVAHNKVQAAYLAELIARTHSALAFAVAAPAVSEPRPRISPGKIRASISPGYLVSFEDGQRYRALRRHLTGVGLTPEAYRTKWGLPPDYPMTAANYSARRSEIAKAQGLGRKTRKGSRPRAASRPDRR